MGSALILGLLDGLNIALVAIGLVLVFRANRFVNLSQAQLGIVPMLVLGKLVIEMQMNWWLACGLMIGAGAAIGVFVQAVVVRRLAQRGSLTLLVATIGVSQVLLGLSYFDWLGASEGDLVLAGYPVPFETSIQVGSLSIFTNQILTVIVVPLICVGFWVFFRFTKSGKGIRAAASNSDAARLAGLPVNRLAAITWGLAGALSALAAILSAPNYAVFEPTSVGPDLLLPALGAATFGAFTSFQLTFVAALGLGAVQAAANQATGNTTWGAVAAFAAIMIGLIFRARAIGLAAGSADVLEVSSGSTVAVPRELRNRPWVKHAGKGAAIAAIAFGILLPIVVFTGASQQFELQQTLVTALLVVSVTILVGWGGQISLGQYAFAGVGAFLATRFLDSDWSLIASMLVSGIIGSFVAILIGTVSLRYRGPALAVTTLGFAVLAPAWLFQQQWFWPDGYSGTGASVDLPHILGTGALQLNSEQGAYFAILAIVGIVLLATAALRSSISGKVLIAVRDNEDAASSAGISPALVKIALFAIVGFAASAAGTIDTIANQGLSGDRFAPDFSLLVLSLAVIGGLGSISGAVIATILIFGVPLMLHGVLSSIFPGGNQVQLLLGGLGLLLAVLTTPAGIGGELRRGWSAILERAARKAGVAAEPDKAAAAGTGFRVGATRSADASSRPLRADTSVSPLRVQGLTVQFGALTAVDDVDLEVRAGEIVGLIGTNGAGKSTIINSISGHVRNTGGTIEIFGKDQAGLSVQARANLGLGRTFQDARLYPGLTTREMVEVALSTRLSRPSMLSSMARAPWVAHHDRKLAREADEILDRLGLGDHADVLGVSLSAGLRRVLDLAMQVARRPRLILLDEPTAGLAQRESEAFVPLLREIARDLDAAVLLIEHDMPVILGVTDRIYCLELGRVIAEGVPDEIRQDPRVLESYLGTGAGSARSGALDLDAMAAATGVADD